MTGWWDIPHRKILFMLCTVFVFLNEQNLLFFPSRPMPSLRLAEMSPSVRLRWIENVDLNFWMTLSKFSYLNGTFNQSNIWPHGMNGGATSAHLKCHLDKIMKELIIWPESYSNTIIVTIRCKWMSICGTKWTSAQRKTPTYVWTWTIDTLIHSTSMQIDLNWSNNMTAANESKYDFRFDF